jgi:ABC-type dipeptide/oligopeptide/nickel transport system ATPase component
MKLELKKFDLRTMKDDAVVVLIGKRGSGKSEMTKAIMYEHQKLPIGVVISQTERANHFFEPFVPKMLIYDEYDPSIIAKFLDRQVKITDQYNAEKRQYGRTDLDPRGFLVLDDCLYDKTWPNDKNIRCLFMNGRHFKVFFIITMQYPLGIPPHLRCNVDYVFIFRETQLKQRERIYQQWAGMFPSFDVFNQVMDQCTENYECLVINNKVQSNKLEDQVYWCKAPLRDNFHTCSKELWDMQSLEEERRALGMAADPDDEESFNPNIINKKKNQPKISVKKSY